ncbi:hypothetical protein GDO86_013007 [Hymenochirus boettgeri]|uniref:E3 ubiquitin-protein ligase n=1 Tax=Hymenochirus boettgeri TaxID=247094 RepID=A0A8T2ISG2_9PIPI|nr:hypothetical protein GDO86_013007 [Hymenochirus boettgeri]
MLDRASVVVWEWQEDASWKPYSSRVVHYIEQVLCETPRATSVSLGEADPSLTSYVLDLISMNQFRLDTGTLFPVRRVRFPFSSAPGQGVTWEREKNPSQWVPFETRLSVLIQQAFERKQLGVRLGEPHSGSHICFQTMTQLDFPSQNRIRVRARSHVPYPLAGDKYEVAKSHIPDSFPNKVMNANLKEKHSSHRLTNISQGKGNFIDEPYSQYQGRIKSCQGLQKNNQVLVNENNKGNLLPMHRKVDFNPERKNPRCMPINDNEGLMDFCTGLINCKTDLLNDNCGLSNSSDHLKNSKNEFIHYAAGLLTSDSEKPDFRSKNYSPVSSNASPLLMNSNAERLNSNTELTRIQLLMQNHADAVSGLVRPASSSSVSKPGLVGSDSKSAGCGAELVTSDCRLLNHKPVLTMSGIRTNLLGSESRPIDHKPVLVRSGSTPADSCIEFGRSDCRTDSRPALTRSNSRRSDHRPSLIKSGSQHVDVKKKQSESLYSFDELKHIEENMRSVHSISQNHQCTCPQCLLVMSIKSSSWPVPQSSKRIAREQTTKFHHKEASERKTSIPPVPLCNIRGSGIISPALAGISGLLMSAAGLPVCLSVPDSPLFSPPPIRKKDLQPVPGISGTCRKTQNKKGKKPEEMIKQFLHRVKFPIMEDCVLCLRPLSDGEVGKLYRCSHSHHVRCLASLYKDGTLRCPCCHTLYGSKMGSQPPGKMCFHLIPHSLPGYAGCQTIRIIYQIAPGVQGPGQPNPGKKFNAPEFPLHCYLPNTDKGRKVLRLLIEAWDRRILFPLIPSRVPGKPDSVSISRIPHKIEFGSNLTGKGFPDPQYLDSVLRQLRDWGMMGD